MLQYLENLRDFFSVKKIEKLNDWFISNPVNYATRLCEYSLEVNNVMIETSINHISKINSSKFWNEEAQIDENIQNEVQEQDILRKQLQDLIDCVKELDNLNIRKLSDEDLIRIANEVLVSDFEYDILSDITAFKNSRKREKYFRKQKARLLSRKRSCHINFREVFRKLYSFHFKNLDDEHDLAFTNLRMIS